MAPHAPRIALVTLVLLAFTINAEGRGDQSSQNASIISRWSGFADSRQGRLIVLLTPLPKSRSAGKEIGYPIKKASLPKSQPDPVQIRVDGKTLWVSSLSAGEAFDDLSMNLKAKIGPARTAHVVKVAYQKETYISDRGPLVIPSWVFYFTRGEALIWPAIARSEFWRPGQHAASSEIPRAATVKRGLDLTLWRLVRPSCGAARMHPGPPRILEYADIVIVQTFEGPPKSSSSNQKCITNASAEYAPTQVRLRKPLGDRILVDRLGSLIVVERGFF
jgi:hypothetical protein